MSAIAADRGAQGVVVTLGFMALLVFVPSVLALSRLAARRAPLVALAAVLLAVPGFTGVAALTAVDASLAAMDAGLSEADATRLVEAMNALPAVARLTGVFVAGHILGLIFLAVALWKAGIVPGWAALALGVSQPLHLATVITGAPHAVDGGAWALTALGFVMAALAVLRMSDDEFDVVPHQRVRAAAQTAA
jgi:hypothetical protein